MAAPGNSTTAAKPLGLEMEPAGQLPWLWGTTFVLANLFSLFWLIKAFMSSHPQLAHHLSRASGAALKPVRFFKLLGRPRACCSDSSSCASLSRPSSSLQQLSCHSSTSEAVDAALTVDRRCEAGRPHLQQLPRVVFEWRDMGCTIMTAGESKTILQGVWGCARPGQLHGLLGPSGAGKSTLLDLLTMRLTNSSCTGQLLINKQPVNQQLLAASSVYVPQRDSLLPAMTARESVEFAAALRLPHGTPTPLRRARVESVLQLMGLSMQQHVLVGGALPGGLVLPGLSGSERKQLHIACGVVAGASLVFLDEPTTGLDACSALNIVLFLKGMAKQQGATLLASIHQPRLVIWSQLDQVTLLASGRLMYTGAPDGLVPWFRSLGYVYDPDVQGTTPDWVMDLVALGFEKEAAQHAQQQLALRIGQHRAQHAAQHAQHGQLPAQQGQAADKGVAKNGCRSVHPAAGMEAAAAACALWQAPDDAMPVHDRNCCINDSNTSKDMTSMRGPVLNTSSSSGTGALPAHCDLHQSHSAAVGGDLMTTGQQLAVAAAAFRLHLQQQQQLDCRRNAFDGVESACPVGKHQPASAAAATAVAACDPCGAARGAALVPASAGKAAELGQQLAAGPGADGGSADDSSSSSSSAATGSSFAKYRALLWREWLTTTRNPLDIGGRMLTYAIVGLLWGLIAYDMPADASSLFGRMMVPFIAVMLFFIMPYVSMSLFASGKGVFVEDVHGRLYHPLQWYLAKLTVSLPYNALLATALQLEFYGLAGMRHGAGVMAQAWLVSVLMGLIAVQAVYFCAVVASSQDLAFVLAIVWTCPNLLVIPFMQRTFSVGWVIAWIRYLSPASYAWQALVQLELAGRAFDCSHSSGLRAVGILPELLPESSPTLKLMKSQLNNLGPSCVASGDAVLSLYNTYQLPYAAYVMILLGFFVALLLLTYGAIWRLARHRT